MRTWVYTWKSSDGLRHEGEMVASNKDAVYAALREKGIRAIKVTERIQPVIRKGFSGLRKRDILCIAVFALVLVVVVWFFAADNGSSTSPQNQDVVQAGIRPGDAPVVANPGLLRAGGQTISSAVIQLAQPRPRKWLELPSGLDFAKVFKHAHERYLVQFALPGVALPDAGSTLTSEIAQDFYDNLNAGIVIAEDDAPVVAELKRIVAGMKEDAKKYLTMPKGIEKLGAWLEERQTMEADYRGQYAKRVLRGELTKEDVNAIFSAMGLELIP